MINLFINENDEITTTYTEGAELVSSDMLQDLDYVGQEGVQYQLQDGIFMFTSSESQKIIAETEGITDVDCHNAWCRVSKDTNKVYQEFISSIDEWEEIESLNFNTNNTFMEAVTAVSTSQGTIRYVSNCLLQDGQVNINTVMLHY